MERQPVPLQVEPLILALTQMSLVADEENWFFVMHSGEMVRRYQLTPKHAKRVHLLLQKYIQEYESKFGQIQTELLQATPQPPRDFGFQPNPEKNPTPTND